MKVINKFILLFIIITFIFLCLNKNIALAQTVTKPSIHSLIEEVNSTQSDLTVNKKVKLNIEIGEYYYKEKQIDNALKYLGNAVNELMECDNLEEANNVMVNILTISIEYKKYTVVIQYSLNLLDNLSQLYTQTGNTMYLKNMIGVNYLVATTCNILGDEAYGESYFKIGSELELKYPVNETASLDYVKSNYYYYQENYSQAKKYANMGIKISQDEKNEKNYLYGLIYLSRVEIKENQLNLAQKNLDIIQKALKNIDSNVITAQYYFYYGCIQEQLGKNKEAISSYLEAYRYTNDGSLDIVNAEILYNIGNLYNQMGEYQNSVEYYKKYIMQEQQLSSSEEKINANMIISMHDHDPQNILNEIKIKKSQLNIKLLTLLFIGVLILAGVILSGYYKKKKNIKKLNSQLNRDILTKAFNRRYTMAYMQKLDRKKVDFSIAMLDVDNYKIVNDTYGHLFGDVVLKKLVKTIDAISSDKVSVCRYGGEEFLLVFEFEDFESTVKIMKRILRAIESIEWEYGNTITASCGLTKHLFDERIYKTLERADRLLYIAKRNGKNRVEV
ncbi:MAG: tetratricopeptide repeat-containing diguanylate cyclase [Sarcina sp.]